MLMQSGRIVGWGAALLFAAAPAQAAEAADERAFAERDGLVAVEAEDFVRQRKQDVRRWYTIGEGEAPEVEPDGDPSRLGEIE